MDKLLGRFGVYKLQADWQKLIEDEYKKEYFYKLLNKIDADYQNLKIYPDQNKVFEALKELPVEEVKAVIIGQDPYHGKNQANGLAFSVDEGVKTPPSLINIFKELEIEYGKMRKETNLKDWAGQGVLLLNAVLTVEEGRAGSHANMGWERFTDSLIEKLSDSKEPIVFILWGNYAINKGKKIDKSKNLVLTSPHPSPLSSYRGFFGNNHFKKTNEFLEKNNKNEICW